MDASLFHGNLVRSSRIIYTPSAFARTNLIHLQEIGTLKAEKPHTSHRENLSSYLFFLVRAGSGELEYDGRSWRLHPGDCVFLDCRRGYYHRSSDDLWTLSWAHFYGPNMGGIYEKYRERGGRACFHPASLTGYEEILSDLFGLAASSDYIKDMRIFQQLTALLTLLMEESWNPEPVGDSAPRRRSLQEVKDFIDANYASRLTLDLLSERFFLNKFHLSRVFKEQFGVTINAYLLQVRITHAKQLLRFSGQSIEQIGQECGMNDANYFSRIFKKIEGVTPGEYRKKW